MKKIIALTFALLLAASFTASAQSYGGIVTSSTTNFLVWTGQTNAYTATTNTFSFPPPSEYIVLTNVVSTSEVFTGAVYVQIPQSLLVSFPGYSNMIYIGSITQSFAGGLPAAGIWSTSTIPVAGSFALPIVLQAGNGIWTNGIYAKP